MINRPVLTLYGRPGCHLCDDMLAALKSLRGEFPFVLDVVDVDCDQALEARYGEFVPLLEAEDREICRYSPDTAAVRAYLASVCGT